MFHGVYRVYEGRHIPQPWVLKTNRLWFERSSGIVRVNAGFTIMEFCLYTRISTKTPRSEPGCFSVCTRARTRTVDPLIKSQLLYQLSYACPTM